MAQSDRVKNPVIEVSRAKLQANEAGLRAFTEGMGLSMHWGLYSVLGLHEWCLKLSQFDPAVYAETMRRFNPVRFNAEEWADLLLEGGFSFLLITTKHHDGFCLWDSAVTERSVMNTPFGRDIIGELAPALRALGIKLHFYYSLMDWDHPAYGRSERWAEYMTYMTAQLRELLTQYGAINGVLFDGYWPTHPYTPEQVFWKEGGAYGFTEIYDMIHTLQPEAVITNNHHVLPLPGEDYQVWELDYPGEDTVGWNCHAIGPTPQAVWWNLNAGWSYQPYRHQLKSYDQILLTYQRCRRDRSTLMLNVGPRPWGDIHPDEAAIIRRLGTQIRSEQKGRN